MPSGWRPRLPKPSLADPGEGPSAASPRRRRLLWTLLILLVLFLIGAFASATRPRHRDLVLLDELAAARSTESRIAALNRSFRSSFRSPPLPSDLAIPRTFRLLPTEADGLGSGWTFLLLQGLGEATADSALQTQSHLMSRHGFGGVTWLIPQAPRRTMPVAPNPKMADAEPPAWFGISTFEDLHRAEDLEGYRQSARAIHRLLREENVDPSRLIIGGFSMGALRLITSFVEAEGNAPGSVMSLIVSLTMDPAPAGVYVLVRDPFPLLSTTVIDPRRSPASSRSLATSPPSRPRHGRSP